MFQKGDRAFTAQELLVVVVVVVIISIIHIILNEIIIIEPQEKKNHILCSARGTMDGSNTLRGLNISSRTQEPPPPLHVVLQSLSM